MIVLPGTSGPDLNFLTTPKCDVSKPDRSFNRTIIWINSSPCPQLFYLGGDGSGKHARFPRPITSVKSVINSLVPVNESSLLLISFATIC